jgi:sterol 3beta-glucosyltransferase
MRVSILIPGTQGDVRPLAALGRGLNARGHRTRVITVGEFASLVESAGLEMATLSGNLRAVTAENQATFERSRNIVAIVRTARRLMREMVRPWVAEATAACRDADLIIAGGGAVPFGASIAEALGKPFVQAYLQPNVMYADLPSTLIPVPHRPWPASANRAANRLLTWLGWLAQRPAVNGVIRAGLGLPPYPWLGFRGRFRRERTPALFGFSDLVVPSPAGWPEHARATGFWFLDGATGWTPPARLEAFLAIGPKPVYIGFGSMTDRKARAMTERVLEALALTGHRAVLATGWGGLAGLETPPSDRVLIIEGAPHDWLFPRMALAVHHGGAGTTAAAMRAGIPSVIAPFIGDQWFWAWRAQSLGVAPPTVRRKGLTAETLAHAIEHADCMVMRARARELGRRLEAENGVAAAIRALSDWSLLPAESGEETRECASTAAS